MKNHVAPGQARSLSLIAHHDGYLQKSPRDELRMAISGRLSS
jgi:hypothetical protein